MPKIKGSFHSFRDFINYRTKLRHPDRDHLRHRNRLENSVLQGRTQCGSFEYSFLVKVMLALCLLKDHAMSAYGEVQVWFHAFVAQTVDGGEWSGLRLGRFVREKNCRWDMRRGGPQDHSEIWE